MTRRSPGTGSAARLRSDGRYEARVSIGHRRQRSFFGGSARDAERKRDEFLRQMAGGVILAGERVTVERYLRDWLEVKRPPAVRRSTWEHYVGTCERYIIPAIGSIPLAKLTPGAVERMLSGMLSRAGHGRRLAGRKSAGEGEPHTLAHSVPADALSPRTVAHVRAVLRTALNRAVRHGDLARNVAALAEPPKVPDAERLPLAPDEIVRLLDAIRGHRDELLILLALTTGMRQGELLGLTWQAVDLDAGVLHVRHTLDGRTGTLSEPKTRRSRRTLAIPADVMPLLTAHRIRQLEQRVRAGAQWIDTGLVFTTRWGRPLSGVNVTHRYQRLLAEHGLRRSSFHDLRHAHATMLAGLGVRPEEARDQLGHASIRTTLETYSHAVPDSRQRIADLMSDALRAMREAR